jgi:hypothetical protein
MGREQDVTDRDVVKLLAVARRMAKESFPGCGECLRARGAVTRKIASTGCACCLSRQVIASIAVRGLARKRKLNKKRAILREVGRKLREEEGPGRLAGAHV